MRGRELLKDVVQNTQDDFRILSDQDKESLIKEFDEHKATQAKGLRVSNKSRVNDITYTIGMVEKEVHVLHLVSDYLTDFSPPTARQL